jgi:hypothetical protein
VEEMEKVVVPKVLAASYNETMDVELSAEVLEDVIAQDTAANHNETLVIG